MFGKTLVTQQTGPSGKAVNRIYVEDGADIERELYLSILVDRETGETSFVTSTKGGMDIETVAHDMPELIHSFGITASAGCTNGDAEKLAIFSQDGAKVTGINTSTFKPLLAIRIKELITNNQGESKRNLLRVFPLLVSMVSSQRAQFLLVKNPDTMTDATTSPVTNFTSSGTLAAIEYNSPDSSTNAINAFTGGEQLATFYTGDADASTQSLTDIFHYARQYLTREATAATGTAGDVLVIAARSLDAASNTCKASLTWGQR